MREVFGRWERHAAMRTAWQPAHPGDTPGELVPGEGDAPKPLDLPGLDEAIEAARIMRKPSNHGSADHTTSRRYRAGSRRNKRMRNVGTFLTDLTPISRWGIVATCREIEARQIQTDDARSLGINETADALVYLIAKTIGRT